MTDAHDPLLSHVLGEAERMERAVDRRYERRGGLARLRLDETAEPNAEARVFTWRYRFTWQEAERSRRYVIALPVDRCVEARRTVEEQIESWLADRSASARTVGPTVRFRPVSQTYEVTTSVRLAEFDPASTH